MTDRVELVFVPSPFMGHILSTVKVAKDIIRRNQNIVISVHIMSISTRSSQIKAYLDAQLLDNPFQDRLIFVTYPPLADPTATSNFSAVIEVHKLLVKQWIEERVKAGLSKPVGFVLDVFSISMLDVASELHVSAYVFFTSGANLLNLLFYSQSLVDDHNVDIATEFSTTGFSAVVPGFKNPVTSEVIPAMLQDRDGGCQMALSLPRRSTEIKGILVNTFVELESLGIQALVNSDDRKIPPVYPVGPILEVDKKSRGGCEESESVLLWLDCQPKSSVIFLCFGSGGVFHEEQVKEIAEGLDRLGIHFLWALRKPRPDGKPTENEIFLEALPDGFLDHTSHRGKIIGWAPQADILPHPAICGFVSHCGWNSILESLWFGVPLATWPIYAEQQLNAFHLVKELEIAVEIRMDYKRGWNFSNASFLVTADEVEKGLNSLMSLNDEMRGKIKKMSEESKRALDKGGSSYNWLGQFIEDVLNNHP